MDPALVHQIVERIKTTNTILVTVSKDPTVDQLAACIGLTLFVNKLNKHGAAVFSGQVPSTLEFLKPEETIETNTDSLRDFIISLDKTKADKLRYKVENDVVKIFITPYKTSLSPEDFEFSQGDFNIETIIALGVTNRDQLDDSITAHGRILHDATVITLTAGEQASDIGAINWHEPTASSLSELTSRLCAMLDPKGLDSQIATALMAGIVAETDRFRNNKTTPQAMQLSAQLMAAGANQQLIAEKLEEKKELVPDVQQGYDGGQSDGFDTAAATESNDIVIGSDGSMSVNHESQETPDNTMEIQQAESTFQVPEQPPEQAPETFQEPVPDIPDIKTEEIVEAAEEPHEEVSRDRIEVPPADAGALTANTVPEHKYEVPSVEESSAEPEEKSSKTMTHGRTIQPIGQQTNTQEPINSLQDDVGAETAKVAENAPEPSAVLPEPVETEQSPASDTLADIEKLIGSTHAMVDAPAPVAEATPSPSSPPDETQASSENSNLLPPQSLNALPAMENLNTVAPSSESEPEEDEANKAPEVPPPMMPQFFDPSGKPE